jgi:2-(1,2-epoxy-1,2-dihydrophenyl)acetyl-CoA isomerase
VAKEPLILIEQSDGVAKLTLNRPDVLNALNDDLMAALLVAVSSVAEDESVRCVVLTGAGRGFCAGGDLNNRAAKGDVRPPRLTFEERQAKLREFSETARLLHEMPKPTIAMINGPCAGAGVGLVGACDLRFGGRSASIRTAFVEVGLAGDYGSSWFWTRLLGGAKARELLLMSEKFDAESALAFGLLTRLFGDDQLLTQTMSVARRFASKNPWAYKFAKDSLNRGETNELAAQLDVEAYNSTAASREIGRAAKARAEREKLKTQGTQT